MTDESTTERPYGERFAEAWGQLQRYLGDLDANELDQMASADLETTVEMLKAQPALGHAGALNSAAGKDPEDLAVSIVQERLRALTAHQPEGDDSRYGAEFLRHWKNLGGSLSRFRYTTIQELKAADKEEAIKILTGIWKQYATRTILERQSAQDAAETLYAHMCIRSLHGSSVGFYLASLNAGFYG